MWACEFMCVWLDKQFDTGMRMSVWVGACGWVCISSHPCSRACLPACHPATSADDVWFINRRPVFAPEAGVRKFVARNAAGELQGFIFFDACFDQGQLTGWYANVTRMAPDAHPGALNLMMKHFLEK